MSRMVLSLLVWLALAVPATAAESVFASYRGVRLGDPVADVASHFKIALDDVTTVHEPPALVQRLTWRPHRFIVDPTVAAPSLDELEFIFHRGRLVRMLVTYDGDRTEGLTDADLREVFTATYGTPALVSTRLPATAQIAEMPAPPAAVGEWSDGTTLVLVSRLLYPRRVVLTITSIADEYAMHAEVAEAARLEQQRAPARELAQRALDAELRQAQADKARQRNKATFTP